MKLLDIIFDRFPSIMQFTARLVVGNKISLKALEIENWERTNELDALPILIGYNGQLLYFADIENPNPKEHNVYGATYYLDSTPLKLTFIFKGKFYRAVGSLKETLIKSLHQNQFKFGALTFGLEGYFNYSTKTNFFFEEEPQVILEGWKAKFLSNILTNQIKSGRTIRRFEVKKISKPLELPESLKQVEKPVEVKSIDSKTNFRVLPDTEHRPVNSTDVDAETRFNEQRLKEKSEWELNTIKYDEEHPHPNEMSPSLKKQIENIPKRAQK